MQLRSNEFGFLISIVVLITLTVSYSPAFAEPLGLVEISGHAFLADTTDHSGIKVLFEAKSPTAVTDSVFTDSDGNFHIFLQVGIYEDVYYSKNGYVPTKLWEEYFFMSDSTLLDISLDPGVTELISGDLSGRLFGNIIYLVQDDISVLSGDTLVIEPGTDMRFWGDYSFQISGLVLAQGTDTDTITFSSGRPFPSPGDWRGIYLGAPDPNCALSFCHIQYSYNGVSFSENSYGLPGPQLSYCLIQKNSNSGIYIQGYASPNIITSTIQHNAGNGIVFEFNSSSAATFDQCIIQYNSGAGINVEFLSYCSMQINNCIVRHNSANGISLGSYGSNNKIADCHIYGNSTGISCSNTEISRCYIYDNSTGITCSNTDINQCTIRDNAVEGISSEGGSISQCTLYNNPTGIQCGGSSITSTVIRGSNYAINSTAAPQSIIYNDFYENNTNFFGSDFPYGIGQVVTTNTNGDSCDTYSNIFLDPRQVDPANNDFNLLSDSPCIDAGDPSLSFDPDGTIADIGAYYYHQSCAIPTVSEFSADPLTGSTPLRVTFTNLSTGPATGYLWNFGDGNTSTFRDPIHYYAAPDTYSVSLMVTGPCDTVIEVKSDYIIALPDTSPTDANFTANPTDGYAPLEVNFTNLSTGLIDSLKWYFGDGDSSSAENPAHIYSIPDTYSVRLVVYGKYGIDQEIKTDYIKVMELPPILAEFTAAPLVGVAPLGVSFTEQSVGIIESRLWYFGDGDSSIAQNPIHTYDSPGIYTVRLKVQGPNGEDTEEKLDYIHVYDAAPSIAAIEDVPQDQGGWVYISYERSGYDRTNEYNTPISTYFVYRRIDNSILRQAVLEKGDPLSADNPIILGTSGDKDSVPKPINGSQLFHLDGNYYMISSSSAPGSLPPGIWAVVGSTPAHQEDQYIALVPTVADSMSDLIHSVYVVSAETTIPSVYFFSQPDSGYSIDNLAPNIPQGLAGFQVAGGMQTVWHPNVERDLSHYALYRGQDPDFIPSQDNLLFLTFDTTIIDAEWEQGSYYHYKLSAIDIHENESGWAKLDYDAIIATLLQSQAAFFRNSCIEITWQVAGDIANVQFIILRKMMPNGEYEAVSTLEKPSSGTTYSFRDSNYEPGAIYKYRVDISTGGEQRLLFETDQITTPSLPLTLYQNLPNPFNPSTTIKYYLPSEQVVTLNVYDSAGRLISQLVKQERQPKGMQSVEWGGIDKYGRTVSSGVYFYHLIAGKKKLARKMVLLR